MKGFVIAASVLCAFGCGPGPADQRDAALADTSRDTTIDTQSNGCAMQPCTILPQCGCPGLACDVATPSGTACRDVTLEGMETAACDSQSGCAAGYTCFGRNKASATCKKFCMADADCGTPRGRCALAAGSGAGVPLACSSNCDPTDATAALCPTGMKCGLFTVSSSGTSTQLANCTPAGTQTQGSDCKVGTGGDDTLCAKGFRCSTLGSGIYQCRKYCKKNGPACPGALTCVSFIPAYIVDVEYGICN